MQRLQQDIAIRGLSKQELKNRLRLLPGYISGRVPDRYGLGKAFKSVFAHSMFSSIHSSFLQKSSGGADEFGDKWKPLARSTIAARPLRPGDRKSLGILGLGRGGRGLLTASENALWRGIFASTFKRLAHRVGEAKAKQIAAKTAWAILKSRGAKTKLETLGSRNVPILVNTGRLEASLTPGTLSNTEYTPPSEQIAQFHHGSITIGTKVPYASYVHKKRRLWPSVRKMSTWINKATQEASTVLRDKVKDIFQ